MSHTDMQFPVKLLSSNLPSMEKKSMKPAAICTTLRLPTRVSASKPAFSLRVKKKKKKQIFVLKTKKKKFLFKKKRTLNLLK